MFAIFLGFVTSKLQLGLSEERQFLQWMRTNNQFYTGDEYHFRLGVFLSNYRYIQEYNRRNGLTFRLGINKFACHTPSEYKTLLGSRLSYPRPNIRASKSTTKKSFKADDDDFFDWRDKNVVNEVKDQGSCGSCWAFSAIATSESSYAISKGQLLQFSEQNLVDCAPCYGCNGGWADQAVKYVVSRQNGLFNSEEDYPYTGVDGSCAFNWSKGIGKVSDIVSVIARNENDLKEKIKQYGVASVSISAGNAPFMTYAGGILDDDQCSQTADHAVAAVGYGSEDGVDYWIVRNSWGKAWGEKGYVRMSRNKNNQCAIASQAFVAVTD